jgi:hypothetical protein
MATLYPYTFNNMTRSRAETVDKTQQTVMNNKFGEHVLTTYFSDNDRGDYEKVALSQPGVMFDGISRSSHGINANTVDVDSALIIKNKNSRSLEKLSLQQRPFATVPYLGRGSADTALESQLRQGDIVGNKKSVSTVTEQSFMNNQMYPLIDSIKETITNPKYLVQEAALDGWIRGGVATREAQAKDSKHLPNNNSF